MRLLTFILSIFLIFSSCKKDEFGQYHTEKEDVYNEPHDSLIYVDGGTLPTSDSTSNMLVGTRWVLTKYVSAFATEFPMDTLEFISVDTYTINNGAVRTYKLNSLPLSTNYDLSLYYFFPFGGSHYSGQVGATFVDVGEINNTEFIDLQNNTTKIKAWFVKI